MPDPHCCHCELFRVPRVTSPPTGMHKYCSRAREWRRGMVVAGPSCAWQHCAYSASDVTSTGTSVYSDYRCLFICSFSLSLSFVPTFLCAFAGLRNRTFCLRRVCLCFRLLRLSLSSSYRNCS